MWVYGLDWAGTGYRQVFPTLLPNNIKNLRNESVQFATVPCKYLVYHSFHSLAEFFEHPIHIIDILNLYVGSHPLYRPHRPLG